MPISVVFLQKTTLRVAPKRQTEQAVSICFNIFSNLFQIVSIVLILFQLFQLFQIDREATAPRSARMTRKIVKHSTFFV